jgi:hypothetical protein
MCDETTFQLAIGNRKICDPEQGLDYQTAVTIELHLSRI